ncbi:beta-mannosidase [Saccharicrinis carchari]|uniref:Beta-mannosidase B n=2 Tax=Saccharicrinis carchari TaxID=1168039 RepID=A0A521EBL8_SACCC|nr:beta-mannosidase [Saccharicrinis carchari]
MKKLTPLMLAGFITALISCSTSTDKPLVHTMEIKDNWKFAQADAEEWMNASVPGCVHTDLMANGKIEDPFYRLNEHDVQWVDKKDWVYQTKVNITEEWLGKDRIELDFKGLDTHADVYLNGEKILVADNMFRGWTVDVKQYLNPGDNELKIYFHSPIKVGLEKYDNYPHVVHSSPNDLAEIGQVPGNKWVSPHIRKAQSHFGWDWGPRLVTSGIWLPIYLNAWDAARINDLRIVQNNIATDKATLTAEFEVEAEAEGKADLQINVDGNQVAARQVQLQKGIKTYAVDFEIVNPELWWSNGLGEAHLYDVAGKLVTNNAYDEVMHKTGLRTIEVVREKDEHGTSLYVELNGHPVFMKGANTIPLDAFLDRATPEKYEKMILTAKESNHNMLRVWGGGIYEKEIFYDLCDKHGMLVWQDFMFACNMYPGHPEFLESVRHEAEYNIKRLRNHPSVALWCGNNEVLIAWLRWGWKREVEKEDPEGAKAQWKAYKDIFLDVLPKAVSEYDPQRFYWASSPQSGDTIGPDLINGDDHYWGVWWGKEPFENYHTKISRFMSEYGFQSFPEMRTIRRYAEPEDYDIFSDVMKSHQRSSIGNETIELYMLRDYRKPKDFESFIYVGQVLQAEGMKQGMEGHRIAMPFNMGSLYWQLNDCWPVASWSSTDYYQNWKAMQYFSKKAFAQELVAPRVMNDTLEVHVISDRLSDFEANLNLKISDFNGKVLWTKDLPIRVAANSSDCAFKQELKTFLKNLNTKEVLLQTSLSEAGKVLSENKYYFEPVKRLNLPTPDVKVSIAAGDDMYTLELTTDVLAKNVFVAYEEGTGFFSDNYFDLMPGETKTITFTPDASVKEFESKLTIRTIRDTY